ncbi:MAG: hypothetical protein PW734_08445 [Verrucomicrobium sp.]|nr:hypothetical protein [Verrucomicrobium sp.]
MKRLIPPSARAFGLAFFLSACASAPVPEASLQPPNPAYAVPAGIEHLSHATQPYVLSSLDKVTVRKANGVLETCQVNQEGILPLRADGAGPSVRGLSVEALRALVAQEFKGGRLVWVEEFRPARVTVLGEVYHQIHTDMTEGPMRVLDAIAAANGFTPLANTRRVKLVRENAGVVDVYELDLREALKGRRFEQNLLLQPGDVITVPKNFL